MERDPRTSGASLDPSAAFGLPMPQPGDVIAGKYRIEAVLGRGGMSVVYRATHLQLDQQVAIKVLSAAALLLPEYIIRLEREARAVSRIRSEHVVRIHDIGELPPPFTSGPLARGVPYLVMEHLSGQDLAAVLAKRGPLAIELAVECILQACEALAEAHALGIIHRDLKPANLFLTESVDGSPCIKVLDFGISRMTRRPGLSPLTDPGTVLGTPSYMAPEQMEAADTVDTRSDIWALGTILFELLVGRPPYTGESLPQIFVKIMRARSAPRPSSFRSDVPAALDAIVARCLAVDPGKRYANVADLAWALSALGSPHARDTAERISRVYDRRSMEPGAVREVPPPVVVTARKPESRTARRVAGALATSVFLAAAGVFSVLSLRDVIRTTPPGAAAERAAVAEEPREPEQEGVLEREVADGALTIAPVTRPAPAEPAKAAAPANVVAALPVSVAARAALEPIVPGAGPANVVDAAGAATAAPEPLLPSNDEGAPAEEPNGN